MTRAQLNSDLAVLLTAVVEIPAHLETYQRILNYLDEQVSGVTANFDLSNYYNKTQVNTIADSKITNPSGATEGKVLKYSGGSIGWGTVSAFDTYITGTTFNNNKLVLQDNNGGTFSTYINSFTGLTVNGIISGTTYYGDGSHLTGVISVDVNVTGGTYNSSTGIATFRNNQGGTFNVSGFLTGYTDTNTFITGGTYSNGTTTLRDNNGGSVSISGYYTGTTIPNAWLNTGNSGLTAGTNFIGTTDAVDVYFKRNNTFAGIIGSGNTTFGLNAGNSGKTLNIGITAFGVNAMPFATSTSNNAFGNAAGGSLTTGQRNTFLGGAAGFNVDTGSFNTYVGYIADSTDNNAQFAIALGYGADASSNEFAISPNISQIKATGLSTAAGYVLTDVAGNGILTLKKPVDTYLTGGTYSNGTVTFRNNSGGTFSVSGFLTGSTGSSYVLSNIGSASNPSGATINGNVLTLQPASASYGGILSTGAQDIMGEKSFYGNIILNGTALGINTAPSYSLDIYSPDNVVASFNAAGIPFQIVIKDEGMQAGYDAPLGSLGNGNGTLCLKYGSEPHSYAGPGLSRPRDHQRLARATRRHHENLSRARPAPRRPAHRLRATGRRCRRRSSNGACTRQQSRRAATRRAQPRPLSSENPDRRGGRAVARHARRDRRPSRLAVGRRQGRTCSSSRSKHRFS